MKMIRQHNPAINLERMCTTHNTNGIPQMINLVRQQVIAFDSAQSATLLRSIRGWVNRVRFADTWGLRKYVFRRLVVRD